MSTASTVASRGFWLITRIIFDGFCSITPVLVELKPSTIRIYNIGVGLSIVWLIIRYRLTFGLQPMQKLLGPFVLLLEC